MFHFESIVASIQLCPTYVCFVFFFLPYIISSSQTIDNKNVYILIDIFTDFRPLLIFYIVKYFYVIVAEFIRSIRSCILFLAFYFEFFLFSSRFTTDEFFTFHSMFALINFRFGKYFVSSRWNGTGNSNMAWPYHPTWSTQLFVFDLFFTSLIKVSKIEYVRFSPFFFFHPYYLKCCGIFFSLNLI